MKIPIPCKFGECAECNNKHLPLVGVSWFKWTKGIEYTYFFNTNDKWHTADFYTTFDREQAFEFTIPDKLLIDDFIKHKGYPLKGRGYANGIHYSNGKTYIDFIMTDNYFAHIKVQCNENGLFMPEGDIIFPTSWDTDEKKGKVVLKSYKFHDQPKPVTTGV